MNLYLYVAAIAVAVVAIVEVLIAYKKYELKKHFLEELDAKERDETKDSA